MLFIRAIQYVARSIEEHLAERLGITNGRTASVEALLVDKLKMVISAQSAIPSSPLNAVPKSASKPSTSSSQQPPQGGRVEQQPPQEGRVEQQPLQIGAEKAEQVLAPPQDGVKSKEHGKELADEKFKEGEKLSTEISKLSLAGPSSSAPQAEIPAPIVESEDKKLDSTRLRIALTKGAFTWGQFVSCTKEDFVSLLENGLKADKVEDQKMYVLAWYRRQLLSLCDLAQSDLESIKREETLPFDVDKKILGLINDRAKDAQALLEIVLSAAEVKVFPDWVPLPEVKVARKPGESEIYVEASLTALTAFHAFCLKQDEVHGKNTSFCQEGAMANALFDKNARSTPSGVTVQDSSNYVIENLFKAELYRAYKHFRVSLPGNLMGFSADTAGHKLGMVGSYLDALYKAFERFETSKISEDGLYEEVLQQTDHLKTNLQGQRSLLSWRMQRSEEYCEAMHTAVTSLAPEVVARNHQSCYK